MNELQALESFTTTRKQFQCLRTKIYFISKTLERASLVIKQRILMTNWQKLLMLEKLCVNPSNCIRWYIRSEDSYDAERR